MPDYIEPIPAVQGQTDWPAMLRDLEKRVEVLSDALEGVKLSMRRLVLAEPWLEEAIVSCAADLPQHPAHMEPAALAQPEQSVAPPLAEVVPHAAVEYSEDAREAVRQAVEDAKAEMPGAFVNEDKPEVSWITAPDDGSEPEALPVFDAVSDAHANDEDAREAVRRAVEAAKAEITFDPAPQAHTEAPAGAGEAAREAVRRTVEAAKGGMGFGWGAVNPSAPPMNQEESSDAAPAGDNEAARETARLAVEQAKAEMGFGTVSPGADATPVDDEEAAREAVRQAVLQARAELETGGASKPVEAPARILPPPHRPERIHPPTITIEDPEGRVELARVYNLLKRLDVAANSSLLNYSSRQVSVQLGDSRSAPEGDNVGDAVREVFERENDVSVDGLNVIVKLGNDYIKAA